MYVCMYVRVHTHTHTCAHLHTLTFIYIRSHSHTYAHIHIHTLTFTYIRSQLRCAMVVTNKGREQSNSDGPEDMDLDEPAPPEYEELLHAYIKLYDKDEFAQTSAGNTSFPAGNTSFPANSDDEEERVLKHVSKQPEVLHSMQAALQEHAAVKKWLKSVGEEHHGARGAVDVLMASGLLSWSRIRRLTPSVLAAEGSCICMCE
jgi:hypothetical protein